ncbi:MAG TPA: hypothetical protein VE079_21770 [Ensifer sp.]|nr:hypothetical protein [Ensifer sp.]
MGSDALDGAHGARAEAGAIAIGDAEIHRNAEQCDIETSKVIGICRIGPGESLSLCQAERPGESRALYAVADERGGRELVLRIYARMVKDIAAMLVTVPDARFDDPEMTAFIGLSAVTGPVKAVLDGQMPARREPLVENELIELLSAYLQTDKLRR